jgi:perosamine synthetase
MGPVTAAFEQRLQVFLEVPHVVATATGTAALHLALASLDREDRVEVIVPSLTFAASVQAILMAGYRPVFAEVDPTSLTISPADVARLINPRTRAVLPVHFAGAPCDLTALDAVAEPAGLAVVEDAAHAFGSRWQGQRLGSRGNPVCFSFSANKNITCGEGGAVATRDARLAERIRQARYLGIEADTWQRQNRERPWAYAVRAAGYRYHLSDLQAAIGLEQLDRLEGFRQRRCAIAQQYHEALAGLGFLQQVARDWTQIIPHLYVVRVIGGWRDALYTHLRAHDIHCGVHYVPNHLQPAFRAYHRPLPITEQLAGELLSLPLHTALGDSDVNRVIETVRAFAPARDPRARSRHKSRKTIRPGAGRRARQALGLAEASAS